MRLSYLVVAFLCYSICGFAQGPKSVDQAILLPIGGNTWAQPKQLDTAALDNDKGTVNWTELQQSYQSYFRVSSPQKIDLWISTIDNAQTGDYQVEIMGQKRIFTLEKGPTDKQYIGSWFLPKAGYHTIVLSALNTSDLPYAQVVSYHLFGDKLQQGHNWVENNEGNFFYWGQRGPSVHLNYLVDTTKDIEYYYNEITVEKGQDVVGSYYMANGFDVGYFGIQVNSTKERRVLFSVWSPFVTDNPEDIPQQDKIILERKGQGVNTGEFGNEGSGGQSYLVYNWKSDTTYKFLLKGEPLDNNYTQYTAWFYAPEQGDWQLIASFSRPKTNSYLKKFHSFLENFIPLQGTYSREVYFSNPWVRDTQGNWIAVDKVKFSADNTARKGYRMDYQGGVKNGVFYLKNCGFFDDYTPIGQDFQINHPLIEPQVDLSQLP